MSIQTMMEAAQAGDCGLLQKLMDPVRSGLPADLADTDGWTVLHEAVKFNRMEAVQLLVDRGAAIDRVGGLGWTPLHIACRDGFQLIAEFLIDLGADVNVSCTHESLLGTTPLHLAAMRGHMEIVDMLLEYGVPINQADDLGETALMKAAYSGRMQVVVGLVERGADTKLRAKKGYAKGKQAWQLAEDDKHDDISQLLNPRVRTKCCLHRVLPASKPAAAVSEDAATTVDVSQY